jgi:hypothetical protein
VRSLSREGPAAFDPSDFPSLGGGAGGGLGASGRPNYVGMVKQPSDHAAEFQMTSEDFPALPGAPARCSFLAPLRPSVN